jgi:hypothetical protein
MSNKSDPPKLDEPFKKELASFALSAFDDPDEITKTTLAAARAIIADGKSNRRDADSTRSLLAILGVVSDLRKQQRQLRRAFAIVALFALALWMLEKFGLIQFTLVHH